LVLARGVLSSSEPVLHFGLGESTLIGRVTVSWPSGQIQSFANLAVDRRYIITESVAVGTPPGLPAVALAKAGQFTELSQPMNLSIVAHENAVDELGSNSL